ncbi:hypothetical protein ACEPAG_5219 [Sanghuangporus baumii]
MHNDNDNVSQYSNHVKVLPAHDTKHVPLLVYPFRDNIIFHLSQSDDGANNGTALWLGSQILSAFLTDTSPHPRLSVDYDNTARVNWKHLSSRDPSVLDQNNPTISSSVPIRNPSGLRQSRRRSHAIELGSGVGLTSLVLAAQGWSVLATDTPAVLHSVLRPNIRRNTRNTTNTITTTDGSSATATTRLLGTVQVRALDWTVPPEEWNWSDPECVTGSSTISDSGDIRIQTRMARGVTDESSGEELLGPPFDLILTADTVYSPDLIMPLLRTIKHLILLSASPPQHTVISESKSESKYSNSKQKQKKSWPPVYLALEKRDPVQLASFFSQAHDIWGLGAQRIPTPRIRRAMSRTGFSHWKKEDWEGVEVWKLYLLDPGSDSNCNVTSYRV